MTQASLLGLAIVHRSYDLWDCDRPGYGRSLGAENGGRGAPTPTRRVESSSGAVGPIRPDLATRSRRHEGSSPPVHRCLRAGAHPASLSARPRWACPSVRRARPLDRRSIGPDTMRRAAAQRRAPRVPTQGARP